MNNLFCCIPLDSLIYAVMTLKTFIDVQPPGNVRYPPDGEDVRERDSYLFIGKVLGLLEPSFHNNNGAVCPYQVLFNAMAVGDVDADGGAVMPAEVIGVFDKIRRALSQADLEVLQSLADRFKDAPSLGLVPNWLNPGE